MNKLAGRIAEAIGASGPMSLERFWNIALFDRQDGYYTSRTPIGAAGDFTTAPEISQMFGELIGAWLVAAWRELGSPAPFALAEFGPGRGTLMADILRTARQIDVGFMKAARVRLIETSDRLADEQAQRLSRFDLPILRVRRLAEIEAMPLLLVANELFDAVAIRQYFFDGRNWRERLVGLEEDGFALVEGEPVADLAVPGEAPSAGAILEASPLREAIATELGARIAAQSGAALIIDYGHARSAFGDTLQALRAHGFADPLAEPGRHDITSHVDFERLGRALSEGGATVSPVMNQGAFLLSLGLAERAGILGRDADEDGRDAIEAAVRRLAGEAIGEMGALFKVIAAASAPLALPPFAGQGPLD